MKLGLYIRNMGPQSTRSTLLECARLAEQAAIDHLWVADHVAIPPDQAEGSGGRHLDPLATLAFLAAATAKIGLGTGVLVLPYRPPLAPAITALRELFAAGGKPAPEVIALTSLPLEEPEKATERVRALATVGVTAVVHASRYADSAAFARSTETLAGRIRPALERA